MDSHAKILVTGHLSETGLAFTKLFSMKGISSLYSDYTDKNLYDTVTRVSPEILLMVVGLDFIQAADILNDFKKTFPCIKVIVTSPLNLCSTSLFKEICVERLIMMPVTADYILKVVIDVLYNKPRFMFERFVSGYIGKNTDRSKLDGFDYLCTAVCLCLMNPDYLLFMTDKLYPKIALIHNSKSRNVERSIRNFSSNIRTVKQITGKTVPLTNYELISIITDDIAEKYEVFSRHDEEQS